MMGGPCISRPLALHNFWWKYAFIGTVECHINKKTELEIHFKQKITMLTLVRLKALNSCYRKSSDKSLYIISLAQTKDVFGSIGSNGVQHK